MSLGDSHFMVWVEPEQKARGISWRQDGMTDRWVCCQLGAREHYMLPRALHRRGALGRLITDAWGVETRKAGRGNWKARIASRSHPELRSAQVTAFNWSLLGFEISARARRLSGWGKIVARNEWFGRNTIRWLRRHAEKLERGHAEIVIFAYSYAAREIFGFAKEQGWQTVLGQIDPGPVEEDLVAEEVAREPELAGAWQRAPAGYWQTWREECELADHIVVNSEWSRACVEKAGIERAKIAFIPLAYAEPLGQRPLQRSYPARFTRDRPLRVLFLGQINLRKGAARLLQAAELLKDEPVEFWMAGPAQIDVPERFRYAPQFRWIGRVARNAAGELYRRADVFILPTLSDGFALTQLEALAYALPIIASANCGRVVKSGVNGLLLEFPSADAIAAALGFCVAHPEQLTAFSANSRIDEEFSLRTVGERLASLTQ